MYLTKHLFVAIVLDFADAGWSSLAARRAHNPKVVGSNPAPATLILNLGSPFFKSLQTTDECGYVC